MAELQAIRRVLVTGATGCVGRHALPALVAAGWDVHAIASKQPPIELAGVTWHQANLLDREQMHHAVQQAGATHLLHLAWYIAPGRWAAAPENFEWVEASLALMRAFRASGGARIVTAGSCLEYDWNFGRSFSESGTPRTPHTAYGTCKNALQELTSAYAASTGTTSAWGRIFFLYGPYEHPDRLVASVIRSLLAGEPAKTSHGNQVRDYLFAGDVADAFVALLGSDVTGPINIASGRPITLKEIITRIGQLVGKPDLIRLGAIPAAPTDTPLVVADTTHLSSALAWRPRYDLDKGLVKTIEWWRAQRASGARA
jgi:nucleoside-diphosphate-sugar epimerase